MEQEEIDAVEGWVPTVLLSFIEVDGRSMLHQMWVTALGQTEWREVGTSRMPRGEFADCQVFGEDDAAARG